jgi:hypothetical protein
MEYKKKDAQMTAYIGTKLVEGTPMTRLAYNELRGWTLPSDEDGGESGYLVEYVDGGPNNHPDYKGYISWSPKAVFELSYRPANGMPFGMAVEILKKGGKVARPSWNGKNMFLFFIGHNDWTVDEKHSMVGKVGQSWIAMKTAQDMITPWAPAQSDVLSEDWIVVE